jgi:cytochrome P450
MVEELLKKVDNKNNFDFVETIAYPLPAMVIANILGVTHDKMVSTPAQMFTNRQLKCLPF